MICRVRDLDIHYEEHGEGNPVIILHGFTLDYRSMTGCMEPIFKKRPGWRRFYIDLPGHGQTRGANWINSSDDMLGVVLSFIDSVIPEERFSVVGLSYGGYLARGLVYHRSDWIDGLALIVPRVISHPKDRTLPSKSVLVRDIELLERLKPNEREGFEEVAVIQNEEHWRRYEPEITAGVKIADEKFLERLNNTIDSFSFEVDDQTRKFEKPAVILVGRQDHWVGYQDAWKILENYPRATFAVLDRSGHALQMEQQVLFEALMSDWLDRVSEYSQRD